MNMDSINSIFENLSVFLIFLSLLITWGVVHMGRKIRDREQMRLVNAELSIAEANQKAAEAAKGTAIAVADASAANERTVKLELDTAQQREKTAKAEHELFELKEKLKPRQLSDASRLSLIAALVLANPKGLVKIDCVLGDGEGLAYANQLDEALKAAGWPTTGINQGAYDRSNPVGFGIIVHSKATTPQYAVSLQRALTDAGILAPGLENASTPEGDVVLMIGNKPQ